MNPSRGTLHRGRRGSVVYGVIAIALFLICPAGVRASTAYLSTQPIWSSVDGDTTRCAVFGDVDRDGDLDLVCGNYGCAIALYLNEGGTLNEQPDWNSPDSSRTFAVALADLDDDGDLDLVCGNFGQQNVIYWNEWNQNGGFPKDTLWAPGRVNETTSIIIGDVNDDDYLDIVFGNTNAPTALYLNKGGMFANEPDWEAPTAATMDVALGDVDGDGDLDLVCGNDGGKNTLYLNVGGSEIFTPESRGPVAEDRTFAVALGDVDGDGDLDLVCANVNGESALYKNSDGTFDTLSTWTSGEVGVTTSVALGDVDGDGVLDAIFGTKGQANTLYVNEWSEGNDRVFSSSAYVWGSGPANGTFDITPGDVDGDGDLDVLCANGSGDDRRNTLYENLSIPLDPVPVWESSPQNSSFGVALGDVDNDGDLDVSFGNGRFFDQSNTIYKNEYRDAEGPTIVNRFVLETEPSWVETNGSKTVGVALADLDGNGFLDLVAGNAGAKNTVHFDVRWIGEGQSGFERRWESDDSALTITVAVGDVNGDGRPDIVCGNGGTEDRRNMVYLNQGTEFSAAVRWESSDSNATIGVALGDVDGDGDLDLVCGNYNAQSNTLYLNEWNEGNQAVFSDSAKWESGFKRDTFGVALGDVDGDGDLDLVCGNAGTADQANTVYLNNGGVFSTTPDWESGLADRSTFGVALGDIDGDGALDLACGNGGTAPERNTLYLNTGGPEIFTAKPVWEADAADWTFGVAMGDVDDDGDVDLVFANAGVAGESNKLYLGRKDPVFKGIAPCNDNPLLPCVTNATPNNPAYLVGVRVEPPDDDWITVSFVAIDAESDRVWIVPEYQYEGDPTWIQIPDSDIKPPISRFQTSLEGVRDSLEWNVHLLPFDPRPVVLRLRVVEIPRRVSVMRQIASYIKPIGPIEPVRPEIAVNPGALFFQTVPVCGSTEENLVITNTGTAVLSVNSISFPGGEMWPDTLPPYDLNPGSAINIAVRFEPKSQKVISDNVRIASNDTINPVQLIPVGARAIGISSFTDPGDNVPDNTPVRVDVSLPDGCAYVDGELYIREGGYRGRPEWEAESTLYWNENDGLPPRDTIPEWAVGSRGAEYKVVARVILNGDTLTLSDPPCEDFISLKVRVGGLRFPYGLPHERYRMISIPLKLESGWIITAFDELGSPGPKTWRLWGYYDSKIERYQELPDPHSTDRQKFERGRAYWLVTRSGGIRLNTHPDVGLTAPTDSALIKDLKPGWNMIGDPFNFNVAWDSIRVQIGESSLAMTDAVARGLIGRLWHYEHDDKTPSSIVSNYFSYDRAEVLVPFEGYFVKNLNDTTIVLHIPPIEAPRVAARPSPPARVAGDTQSSVDEWTIQIAASSAGMKDPYNYIGVKRGASSGWDPEDQAEPPSPPGGSLFLYFPHYGWKRHPGCYATDIRGGYEPIDPAVPGAASIGDGAAGQAFYFDVAMSLPSETSGDEIVLEFAGIDGVPAEARVMLADRRLNRVVDLRRECRYGFYQPNRGTVAEKDARFVVLVGSKDFIETEAKELEKIPARTVLRPNFPNPFNPITIVRYELAKPARVTLRIYDVSGKLVKVLVDRRREAGYYEVGWNATNERGEPVASGVYFCRFEGAGVRQTRKMVLLK